MLNADSSVAVELYVYANDGSLLYVISEGPELGLDKVCVEVNPTAVESAIFPNTMQDVSHIEIVCNSAEVLTLKYVDSPCQENHQLSWANNLGGYDNFAFTHNREREISVSPLSYKKQFGNWDSANNYTFDSEEEGDTTYSVTATPTGTIYSGWIAEKYQNWLSEILYSVDVKLEIDADTRENISVTDTKVTLEKHRFNDTLNFQVNYKKTNFKSITK